MGLFGIIMNWVYSKNREDLCHSKCLDGCKNLPECYQKQTKFFVD